MKPVRQKLTYKLSTSSRTKVIGLFQYNVKRDVDFDLWFVVSMNVSRANNPLWQKLRHEASPR